MRVAPVAKGLPVTFIPATDYLQGDGPLSPPPIALHDRLTQITYAIRVKALLVSHRTYRVRTHSGFFRALFVAAAVFRGSPSRFSALSPGRALQSVC